MVWSGHDDLLSVTAQEIDAFYNGVPWSTWDGILNRLFCTNLCFVQSAVSKLNDVDAIYTARLICGKLIFLRLLGVKITATAIRFPVRLRNSPRERGDPCYLSTGLLGV